MSDLRAKSGYVSSSLKSAIELQNIVGRIWCTLASLSLVHTGGLDSQYLVHTGRRHSAKLVHTGAPRFGAHWGFHEQFVFTVSQCAQFGCPSVHHLVCVICPNVHHFGCPNVHHLVCGRCPNVHHLARVQCPSVHHQWVFFLGLVGRAMVRSLDCSTIPVCSIWVAMLANASVHHHWGLCASSHRTGPHEGTCHSPISSFVAVLAPG